MANFCAKCSDNISINDLIVCANCSSKFHFQCAGLREKTFKEMLPMNKKKWKCGECKQPKPISTPVRDGQSLLSIDFEKLTNYIDKKFDNFQAELKKTLFKDIEKDLSDMRDSMGYISSTYDDLKADLEEKSRIIIELKRENEQVRSDYNDLHKRLSAVESQTRDCNLELQCVPENRSENLVNLSMQLSSIVNGDLHEQNILAVHRVAKMDKESQRPRSIILKLSSPRCRDSFLAAIKKFNKKNPKDRLNSSHLGIGGGVNQPVYVSEHLTPAAKQLHAATRTFAKEHSVKFVWVRNGRVYLRKDEHSQSHIIHDIKNLKLIKL